MGISAREFARRDGCSDTLVRRAGKNGKLSVSADGTYDPDQVGGDWRPRDRELRTVAANSDANSSANTEPKNANTKKPRSGANTALSEAIARKEDYTARLRQLEFEQKSGALVSIDLATTVLFDEARTSRDSWLNWPTSVAPHLAAELGVDPDKLVEALTRYVHEHLSELGEPAGDFSPRD